jgi:hypothetical protein
VAEKPKFLYQDFDFNAEKKMDMVAHQHTRMPGDGLLVLHRVQHIQQMAPVFSLSLIVEFGVNEFGCEVKIARSFKVLLFHVNRVTARTSPAQN